MKAIPTFAVWIVGAAVAYTVVASLYNRGYISGAVNSPLPNPLGNAIGLR